MFYELTNRIRLSGFIFGMLFVIILLTEVPIFANFFICRQTDGSESKVVTSDLKKEENINYCETDNTYIKTIYGEEMPCLVFSGVEEVILAAHGDISVEDASKKITNRKHQQWISIESFIERDIAFSLDLSMTHTNDEDIKKLVGAKKLVSLDLSGCGKITDKSLTEIAKIKSLKKLGLYGTSITKRGLLTLELPNLRDLDQDCRERFYDKDMLFFTKMPLLEKVILVKASLTDRGVSRLTTLTHLKGLSIGDHPKINGECLKDIAGMQSLEILSLDGSRNLNDDAFAELVEMPHLRMLTLNWTRVGEEAFTHISRFRELEELIVDSPNITDGCIQSLSSHSQLRLLRLHGGKISDKGLVELTSLSALKRLYLTNYSDISDEGIQCLAKIGGLESILFDSCENITESGISQLQKQIPECNISLQQNYKRDSINNIRITIILSIMVIALICFSIFVIALSMYLFKRFIRPKSKCQNVVLKNEP